MKKIQTQSVFTVNSFDYKVVYNSDGSATIVVALLNDTSTVKTEEIPITKEVTDQWQSDDSIIMSKIQEKFPSIDLTEITE